MFGDIRMIHDPLASRRRAAVFGLAAVVLIAGVMGLFAWMRPNPNPGEAPIIRASDGSLYVRVGEAVHPVTNLTSARLIAGAAEEPARVGDEHLAAMGRGIPVGIVAAPSMFAPQDSPEAFWSVCNTTVIAGEAPEQLLIDEAVLATDGSRQWLVTAEGRQLLPPETSPEGRIVRRGLGVGAGTPVWAPPSQILTALRELPPMVLPNPLPELLHTGEDTWLLHNGAVQKATPTQRAMLLDAGAAEKSVPRDALASYPDGDLELRLPAHAPRWVDPETRAVCVTQARGGATLAQVPEGVELSGASIATHFAGLAGGSVGVDSGHGYHVVSANGLRHSAPDKDTLATVGAEHVEQVPWEIISLLPEGAELSREAALTATY